jgi:hypothetical protein
MPFRVGIPGDLTFFYKLGNPELARTCALTVYDITNDHFERFGVVREMASLADVLTCGSEVMAERTWEYTGRRATVIDDPWETTERPPAVEGEGVLWFGHAVNLPSLRYVDLGKLSLTVCSNAEGAIEWSMESEARCLDGCAVALVTGTHHGASSNRVVKALRAGRFVVMSDDCAESWRQFSEFCWIGNVQEGVRWALNNRETACRKVLAGQAWIRERFSPSTIGGQWASLFGSTLAQGTISVKAG